MATANNLPTAINIPKQEAGGSSNLCREDFDIGPVSLDEIEKGLYLGNLSAATHTETLKNYKISYILTLDSVQLPAHIVEAQYLTTKYVHVSDMPKEDMLHRFDECIEFIETALNEQKNILVHCYFGVSRSSSIVIAYMMKKYNLEYSQAFERVKSKRRFVQPNAGFIFQLKLYRRMGCKMDPNYQKYKTYCLRLAADKVKKAKILPQMCMEIIKPDPGLTQENPDPISYRCRKCRRIIATKSNILTHVPKPKALTEKKDNNLYPEENSEEKMEKSATNENLLDQVVNEVKNLCSSVLNNEPIAETIEPTEENKCKSILFIEPIAWMKDILHQTQGRLNCPKCSQKLGSFSWINGCHCPCGTEIAPAFYLIPSRVDLSHVVQNLQMTF